MKCLLLTFPSHSRKLLPSKNEDFYKIAKVFSVNFLHRMKFAKLKFAKFRDFGDSRKFLPAKVSAFKVRTYLLCRVQINWSKLGVAWIHWLLYAFFSLFFTVIPARYRLRLNKNQRGGKWQLGTLVTSYCPALCTLSEGGSDYGQTQTT